VTLDLNGFTISSTAASATGSGILINSSVANVAIVNGSIRGAVTDNGSGTFNGSGFANGIYCSFGNNIRVSNVSVSGCLTDGIFMNGNATVAEKCLVYTAGNRGISANLVSDSAALDCGSDGIDGTTVANSYSQSTYGGIGINCQTANNSFGASGSGTGLNAGSSANNCFGTSGSGYYGIYTVTAINCYGTGYSTNSVGILAYDVPVVMAMGGSQGIYSYGTAIGCYGSASGTGAIGLTANIANSCDDTSSSINNKYNMP